MVVALPAVLGAAALGCADDPYKSGVKAIIQDVRAVEDRVVASLQKTNLSSGYSVSEITASLEVTQQQTTDMVAAVSKAQIDLQKLDPPDEKARAFAAQYRSYLEAYADVFARLSSAFVYMHASFAAVEQSLAENDAGGVWQQMAAFDGVEDVNLGDALDVLRSASPIMSACIRQWEVISPPEVMAEVHGTVTKDFQTVVGNVNALIDLADGMLDSGSQKRMPEFLSLWKEGAAHWSTMNEDFGLWSGKVGVLVGSIMDEVDQLFGQRGELQKALDEL
jgi:hypothetical protein